MLIVHGGVWDGSRYQSNFSGRYAVSEATAPKYGIDWASGQGVGHPYRKVHKTLTRIPWQPVVFISPVQLPDLGYPPHC